jgi:CubicO group peptidase (beta-lactamase class C family)
MYKKELPRVSPEMVGIPSSRLLRLAEDLDHATEMHGFMIARNGKVAAEAWWAPYSAEMPHICHSLGKSYVGTAIGLACTEGIMSVDDRIVDLFSDEIKQYGVVPNDNMNELRVRHLLTMSNGMARHPALDENLVRNYLTEPIVYKPGSRFMYNTAGTSMLCAIIKKVTGMEIRDYMTDKLFRYIGIETDKLRWLKYKSGLDASPGIASTTENNLRLGMLYLQCGKWEETQYISESWIHDATTRRIDNSLPGADMEASAGYGYQIWLCTVPDAFRFDGGHGQFVVVSPRHGIVISINQSGMMPSGTNRVLEIVNKFLNELDELPCVIQPENYAENEKLKTYLNSRRIAAAMVTALPDDPSVFDGIYRITKGEFHIYPELRANDRDNLDRAFYSIENEYARTLSIQYKGYNIIEILIDHLTRLIVRLDGVMELVPSIGAIPTYDLTCSTGFFDGSGTLVIHTRWIHTCLCSTITLRLYPNELVIDVMKSTLHESSTEIHYFARAKRCII